MVAMGRPLIGLTGRRWPARRLGTSVPAAMADLDVDVHFTDYGASVAEAGGLPVELTRDADVDEIVEHLDGLVLSGGADLDPVLYGAVPDPHLGEVEPSRDAWELALYAAARAKGIPVLGICRGFQLVNVAEGGSLRQHVELEEGAGHPQWDVNGRQPTHEVLVNGGTMLAHLVPERLAVNSLHHQVVERVGEGLRISAVASDGVVEGVESADGELLAVQWHPELLTRPDPTFRWLVEAARRA